MQLASLQRLNMHTIATLIYVHPLTGMNTSCRSSLALIRVSLLPTAGATATSSSAGVSNTAHIIPRQERERERAQWQVCVCVQFLAVQPLLSTKLMCTVIWRLIGCWWANTSTESQTVRAGNQQEFYPSNIAVIFINICLTYMIT